MRTTAIALVLVLSGCVAQPALKIDDREATTLLIGQWSRASGHWTFIEGGEGFFETSENTSHAPFAYEFIWRVENTVLHIEYEAPIKQGENRQHRYTIQEVNQGKLVLRSLQESRSLVLINDNF